MIKYSPQDLWYEAVDYFRKPTSILRYGDGEAMILSGDKDKAEFVIKRQMGFIPPDEHIEQIRNNLIEAYRDADIIGIPTKKRLRDKDSYWYKAFGILVDKIGIEYVIEKQFTDIDFHSVWLEKDWFKSLLSQIDSLTYISCRDLDEPIKKSSWVKEVHSFIIAPEAKFTSYVGEPHYPDQFNKVKDWIKTTPKGNICLIGAGVIGKIYGKWIKEHGGIAIDIGHIFDLWAGKATRGLDRGLDLENTKYKL